MDPRLFDEAGDGPAVLLLHAGIADRRMWRDHLPWLASAGWRAIAPDLPGFGEHAPSADSAAPWDFVRALLDDLGVEHAVVCGCSFGGAVALRLAVTAPERVRALVLISTPAPDMVPSPELHAAWTAEEEAMDRGDIDAAVSGVLATWLRPDAPPEVRRLVETMQRRAFALEDPAGPVQHPDPLADRRELMSDIAVPTLVAVGQSDLSDFAMSARTLAQSIPGASHAVIDGAGHLAPLETPTAFRRMLTEALDALVPTAR